MGRGEEVPPASAFWKSTPIIRRCRRCALWSQRTQKDARVETCGRLLYDEAVIAEGSRIADPTAFARRINELMAAQLR